MSELNVDKIIERHSKFPKATKTLIEQYAFNEYKKCISDLLRYGKRIDVDNSDVSMIVISRNDLDNWTSLKDSHWYLNDVIKNIEL